jgi:selenocysteine lyase/cysteine desulfurase
MIDQTTRSEFAAGPGYLNTSTVGLPPRRAVRRLQQCLVDWEAGRCDPPSFDADVDRARAAYALLTGVDTSAVAIISQTSMAAGVTASSLPDRARVLCAEEDFTSVLFPFLADPRLRVELVPLAQLVEQVDDRFDLVAVSAVQSSDGRVIDLDALVDAAAQAGARTYVDVTQAAGWLRVDAQRFDVTACAAYKWLCSPRGTGFLTVGTHCDWLAPKLAGWYSSASPWTSIYGPPLRLADDARRFNVSPAWFGMAAAAEAIELLAGIGVDVIGRHSVALANNFRARVGLPASNSATVAVDTDHHARLRDAGIAAATRAGRVRLSFYVYNTDADADAAAMALR